MAEGTFSCIILEGKCKLPHSIESILRSRCGEMILVAGDPLQHLDFEGLIVADRLRRHSPFSAIYAGLFAADNEQALVVDGNRPNEAAEMVCRVLEAVAPRWDLVITETETGPDPCLAVYSKRCLKSLARHLDQDAFTPEALYSHLNMRVLGRSEQV